MALPSDEMLAARAAGGDCASFEVLLQRYKSSVYRICLRTSGNREDAEDWAQECFVRAYQQLGHYSGDRPFSPWFYRVITNTCINLAKKRESQQRMLHHSALSDELATTADGPEASTLKTAEIQQAQAAMEKLSPVLRTALVVWLQEQITFKELGQVLGVPLTTAATRVRRALLQLEKVLRAEESRR